MRRHHLSLLLALIASAASAAESASVPNFAPLRLVYGLRYLPKPVNPLVRYAIRSAPHVAPCAPRDRACRLAQARERQEMVRHCVAGERSIRCLQWWRAFALEGYQAQMRALRQFDDDRRVMDHLTNALKRVHAENEALWNQNEKLAAETDDAKQRVEAEREDANRRINQAYDDAERAIDAAQAQVSASYSDSGTFDALAIMNAGAAAHSAARDRAPSPSIQCTSRAVGTSVQTDCN